MSFRLASPPKFERRARRFVGLHSNLGPRLARMLRDLAEDPFQAHLGLHALRSDLQGFQPVRITYSYRLIVQVDSNELVITLLDTGTDDEVYRCLVDRRWR